VPFYFPDVPPLPLPAGHRFPAAKYALLRREVLAQRIIGEDELVPAPAATAPELARAHDPAYVGAVMEGTLGAEALRRIGLPWSPVLRDRALATVGGSLAAARAALVCGLSGQLAGGTHHAHRDFGSGYCVFNDLAVAALAMLAEGRVGRLAILDLDVHQGDGNAAILGPDPRVLVVSMHGARNFPFRKVASSLDIALADGTGDAAYLAALGDALAALDRFGPGLLLYLSGADALAGDRLGRLALTAAGLAERDRRVFAWCRARGVPVSIAIGGGYAEPIARSVAVYAETFRVARAEMAGR
jgi:acetoin utilization deacetylase AcuC-like enzyme